MKRLFKGSELLAGLKLCLFFIHHDDISEDDPIFKQDEISINDILNSNFNLKAKRDIFYRFCNLTIDEIGFLFRNEYLVGLVVLNGKFEGLETIKKYLFRRKLLANGVISEEEGKELIEKVSEIPDGNHRSLFDTYRNAMYAAIENETEGSEMFLNIMLECSNNDDFFLDEEYKSIGPDIESKLLEVIRG